VADYLLDTTSLAYWYDPSRLEHAQVMESGQCREEAGSHSPVRTSFVCLRSYVGEIEYGHRVAPAPDTTRQAEYARFLREQFRDACADR